MVPPKIRIVSDQNELELQLAVFSKVKSNHHTYKYVVSKSKLGQLMAWTEFELDKLLENKLIEAI